MISATENSINSKKKPGFGRKNQLKMWSHLQVSLGNFWWQQPIVWVVVFLIIMCLLFWPRKAEGSRFERSALVFGSVIRIGTFFFWYFSQFGCLMLSALIFVLCLHGFYFFEFCFAKEVYRQRVFFGMDCYTCLCYLKRMD